MKIAANNDLKSVFIESEEIKYVRIDNKNNIVIVLQDPIKLKDRTVIGYRSKLIGDPTGANPNASFKVRRVYEAEMEEEEKIVKDGILEERGMI